MTTTYERILDHASRADPYPLYAELRETPVARQPDGSYVVSTYREIVSLLHDPRVSSVAEDQDARLSDLPQPFIRLDPPDHDRLRRLAMRHFGPPESPGRIDALIPRMTGIVTGLIDGLAGRGKVDIVDDFAYPLPVTVICELLGVPREDEPLFHQWSQTIISTIDPGTGSMAERTRRRALTLTELGHYLDGLADERLRRPADDLLSGFVSEQEFPRGDLLATSALLLVAGHETTVNLIANGVLTLLRHPHALGRLHREPGWAPAVVEELLRYEPPVQFLAPLRHALADIELAGVTIPRGAVITIALAAGSRDPARFHDPDRFDPDRVDNQHLGFGGGIHHCFGAPLARLETQLALAEFARRFIGPRLVADPPPYRPHPFLRGPRHLLVEFDDIVPA
ncbi:cytochrome P450 [Microtetraspora sp. NBRC 13810]|uniref:cytochrome P450 n=1 Tax=Microtetraspora sp. NBRC 13810 TaxID=3030990 RepID=UPI002556702C|nr:cytochrome P450 [Microtetraspora sp. NBRC 13810]GLW10219.1 cytochrome P450 [Microtetraspora sp. NBRC 13810]